MNWREYETSVFDEFKKKYPDYEISSDQKIIGQHSQVERQVDVLVKGVVADVKLTGVFDCKHFSKNVDVKVIDSMYEFIDDIGADFGGVVTSEGFSEAAEKRAESANIDLRVITFESSKDVVDKFTPSLDFSDPRNSMYLGLIG